MPPTTNERRQKDIYSRLRKREAKTLAEIAGELGAPVKALTVPISGLVGDGLAKRNGGRPPKYTKA